MATQLQPSAPCPCGRTNPAKKPLAYGHCCGRYVEDFANSPAPDAESLMRSRYSAFVLCRDDYLRATWHTSTRPTDVAADADTRWLGLEVRAHKLQDADHATVEFVARYRINGRAVRIHELSRFVREQGRWYYLDGELELPAKASVA
ncbi:MAG: YchJ family metal-binding protein [Pseudomonadota bacterium]